MNILHMKYAVEVARVGSLSKAAENLLLAQPNLSRSIKELESELHIRIFERSARGMRLTPDGEEFIGYAKEILQHIDQVDRMYKTGLIRKQRFSISVPRSRYISEAFAEFSKSIPQGYADIVYKETNSQHTISNILYSDYRLGIIRYAENYDKYFKTLFEEKGIAYEMIAEFSCQIIMSKDNPLAEKRTINCDDLKDYIRISYADPYVPSLSSTKIMRDEFPDNAGQCIYIFERASRYELLSRNNRTFMWGMLSAPDILEKYGLVQRKCDGVNRVYRDMLIYKNEYKFSDLDKDFITELCFSRRRNIR